jgi:hypothetical protein
MKPNVMHDFLTSALPFSTIACPFDLFRVSPGVPADKALEAASCYLSAVLAQAEAEDSIAWALYLIELAKALIDAVNVEITEGGAA